MKWYPKWYPKQENKHMPKPPVTKPRTFPNLGHGGGSWGWDSVRRKVTLRFAAGDQRVLVRGDSTTECIVKRDARRAMVVEAAEVAARLANGDATVTELMAAWFGFHTGKQAPQTIEGYQRSMRIVRDSALGDRVAHTVTIGDVEDLYLSLVNDGDHGKSSLSKVRVHLRMSYEYGVRHGYATVNPAIGSRFPGHVRDAQKAVWLDKDGFVVMRRYLIERPSTVHVALLTILLTGLRPGEALGLRWDVIDLDAGTVHVRRSLQRSHGNRVRTVVDGLKTAASERVVELPADLVAMLRWLRVERNRRQLGARVWKDHDLVFTRDDGTPLRFEALYHQCKTACVRLGIPPVSANKLRHTNASILLDRGVQVADVSKHLGHKNMLMVMTTYGHSMKAQVPSAALLAAES